MEPVEVSSLDKEIREILEPDHDAVCRAVDRAFSPRRSRPRWLVPVLAVFGVCAAAGLLYFHSPGETDETFTLDCVGEVAVIRAPDGTSWIVSENGTGPDTGVKTGLILFEGDLP